MEGIVLVYEMDNFNYIFFSCYDGMKDKAEKLSKELIIADGHIGFGSDFDGLGNSLPSDLKDVSHYPKLIEGLLKRGYNKESIEKICYKNFFRVWNANLQNHQI